MKFPFAKLASQLALSAAVLSLSGLALAADTIKIGVSGPFTGGSSSMGVSMRMASSWRWKKSTRPAA